MSSEKTEDAHTSTVQQTGEHASHDATLAKTSEMRRTLMKRIAVSGFLAPAVLSTLLSKAAADSLPPP